MYSVVSTHIATETGQLYTHASTHEGTLEEAVKLNRREMADLIPPVPRRVRLLQVSVAYIVPELVS